MAEGAFVAAVEFLDRLGVYDVVLPFLLVFTIVFAILEKTKIFGLEKIGDEELTRKNLNAMAAFVIAFIVVASTNLVAAISEAVANMVLLLILSISFLLLVGSFTDPKEMREGVFLKGKVRTLFIVIMFIGIVLIFLHAIKTDSDLCNETPCTWLDVTWNFLSIYWDTSAIAAIILLLIIGLFMWYIGKPSDGTGGTSESEGTEQKS